MCWPLSCLKEASDVSGIPDEDWGQRCIPWWAKQLAKCATVGQIVVIGKSNDGDWQHYKRYFSRSRIWEIL